MPLSESTWSVQVSKSWDVLGPFPIQAREQHFISPSFPLNLSEPIDYKKTWPSAYADGGQVGWTTTEATDNDELQVSFPNIRWESLRATEGWAALQHHALLHGSLTIYPLTGSSPQVSAPYLLVNLIQGSFFTILPAERNASTVPEWFAGNIYAMERANPRQIPLPSIPSRNGPTKYDVFIAGDYEIRLFGDPHSQGGNLPVQSITFSVEVQVPSTTFVREPTLDVVCNFVQGRAFGNALGIGLRSVSGWWTVKSVVSKQPESVSLSLLRPIRLATSQARTIPIELHQLAKLPTEITLLYVDVIVSLDEEPAVQDQRISVSLPIKHVPLWDKDRCDTILATYLFANSMPSYFAVVPPKYENAGKQSPLILALHGAGVDIVSDPFWSDAMPRRDYSWFVLPSGRTSWGLDWHGQSSTDAWSSVDALVSILDSDSTWKAWRLEKNPPLVILGHSNGGQGAWYMASRYPDRIVAAIPAAGYIKSQAYIPLTLSRSAHYLDPILRAILESSLTPDDNDLFTTNLVDTPTLVIHGGDDENVPVWHSRELVGTLRTNALHHPFNLSFVEDAGQKHWYPSVFQNDKVKTFLDDVDSNHLDKKFTSRTFTLTVSIPAESGSLHGWRIEVLSIPGRLSRLTVKREDDGSVSVQTSNVRWFSVDRSVFRMSSLKIDKVKLKIPENTKPLVRFEAVENKNWKVNGERFPGIQSHGRMQNILKSAGPILLVIPDRDSHPRELSVALRIAHDLNIYHKLDAHIITSAEALVGNLKQGNIVAVGNEASARLATLSSLGNFEPALDAPGLGVLILHPHPMLPGGTMIFLQSTDASGLERCARLFPMRTGVAVPDWLVVGPDADQKGAGGILAAGLWDNEYGYSDRMSWTY